MQRESAGPLFVGAPLVYRAGQRRSSPRLRKRMVVLFRSGDGPVYVGYSSNVSSTGVLIRTRRMLVPGSEVALNLRLPDGNIVFVRAEVVWAISPMLSGLPNGQLGLRFLERSATLDAFLQSGAFRPDVVRP